MPSGSAKLDLFPPTERLWIVDHLASIGDADGDASTAGRDAARELHRELCAFIMQRYHAPLCAYVSATGLRDLGEPQDLVASFFAQTLSTTSMLQRWRMSGIPLRRWLMTAISLHCRGLRRDRTRERTRTCSTEVCEPIPTAFVSAEAAFELAWARAVVRSAAEQAANELVDEGIGATWKLFERHTVDQIPYAQGARELGMPPAQARAANRLAARRFKHALSRALEREGILSADLERAMDDVCAAVANA